MFGLAFVATAEEPAEPEPNFNLAIPTLGGKQLWEDLRVLSGWRVQHNVMTDHYRLLDASDVRRAWGSREACNAALDAARETEGLVPRSTHAVVLLHGLWRSKSMYEDFADDLEDAGYEVVTIAYPSTRRAIAAHADQIETVLENLEGITEVSFVTHSLGGIVMREVLSRDADWKDVRRPVRMVMMGPPNQGSVFARELPKAGIDMVVGASLDELRTISLKDFPAPTIPFAIIAGGRGEEGYNPLIPGNDDGVVAVTETRLDGASDFLVVEGLHSFLPSNEVAARAALSFLDHGSFTPKSTPQRP
jgi:pimeloyl-ACP methyl ester carboxylesterase